MAFCARTYICVGLAISANVILLPSTQELALGTYDGIAGLFTQPVIGAMEEGPVGFVKGFGKGVFGMPFKFWAGMSCGTSLLE
jgi:hypothetical protein